MSGPLWGIFAVLTSTWLTPAVAAFTPLSLPLPQTINWIQYVSGQLLTQTFSTTSRLGSVAAEQTTAPALDVFITNNQVCLREEEDLSYRVVVRNKGSEVARNVTVQFQYPQTTNFRDSDPKPSGAELPDTRLVEWFVADVAPGSTTAQSVVLTVGKDVENVTVNVTVFYTDGSGGQRQTLTSHTIDGPCSDTAVSPGPQSSKQPAIVCSPEEPGCVPTFDKLSLGKNYQQVLQAPGYRAFLGKRFTEAYADIVPGECRVAADDIIVTPEFHDALNRRAQPAARFMRPLYNSGQDFRQFIVENEIIAIPHFLYVRDEIMNIQNQNWQEHITTVNAAVVGEKSLDQALNEFDQQAAAWKQRIGNLREDFVTDYRQIQQRKKDTAVFNAEACEGKSTGRFSTVACQAISNARESIQIACGPPPSDGGLSQSLPAVYQAYDAALNTRTAAYPQTQTDSLTALDAFIAQQRTRFAQVVGASSPQNLKPLSDYARNLAGTNTAAFEALLTPYERHQKADATSDDTIRLQQWEKALDAPKTAATTCEKENVFAPSVETTWCESGKEPELIIREAPEPAKVKIIQPPAAINGGERTNIPDSGVLGDVCGGKPGDPYWTPSCKCHCDQLVSCNGRLVLCQQLYNCTGDPLDKITHHDIYIGSQLECFWEQDDHLSPDAPRRDPRPPRGGFNLEAAP